MLTKINQIKYLLNALQFVRTFNELIPSLKNLFNLSYILSLFFQPHTCSTKDFFLVLNEVKIDVNFLKFIKK